MTLDAAMALYDLHSFELLWEKALDTKVLLAWNTTTCVLCFRGTSSWANVLADLEVRSCSPQPYLHLFSCSFARVPSPACHAEAPKCGCTIPIMP